LITLKRNRRIFEIFANIELEIADFVGNSKKMAALTN